MVIWLRWCEIDNDPLSAYNYSGVVVSDMWS